MRKVSFTVKLAWLLCAAALLLASACSSSGGDSSAANGPPLGKRVTALVSGMPVGASIAKVWLVIVGNDGPESWAEAEPDLLVKLAVAPKSESYAAVVYATSDASWTPSSPFGPGYYAARTGLSGERQQLVTPLLVQSAGYAGAEIGLLTEATKPPALYTISGTVIDQRWGSSVGYARLLSSNGVGAVADHNGAFSLELPAGSHELQVFADYYQLSKVPIVIEDTGLSELQVKLAEQVEEPPLVDWTIQVTDYESGTPVANARVEIDGQNTQTTSASGEVTLQVKRGVPFSFIRVSAKDYGIFWTYTLGFNAPKVTTRARLHPLFKALYCRWTFDSAVGDNYDLQQTTFTFKDDGTLIVAPSSGDPVNWLAIGTPDDFQLVMLPRNKGSFDGNQPRWFAMIGGPPPSYSLEGERWTVWPEILAPDGAPRYRINFNCGDRGEGACQQLCSAFEACGSAPGDCKSLCEAGGMIKTTAECMTPYLNWRRCLADYKASNGSCVGGCRTEELAWDEVSEQCRPN